MSAQQPRTLAEWRSYTAALDDEELQREASAANTTGFVRALQDEGYEADEIHAVLILYAHRFRETGLRPPTGGLYDFFELMQSPLPG